MERTFSPMIRQYSAIDGLQQAYTLVYAMEVEGTQGCRLTLCQIGSRQQIVSQHVAAAPEFCYRLLRYLCENGRVSPLKGGRHAVTDLTAAGLVGEKGGAWREQ